MVVENTQIEARKKRGQCVRLFVGCDQKEEKNV